MVIFIRQIAHVYLNDLPPGSMITWISTLDLPHSMCGSRALELCLREPVLTWLVLKWAPLLKELAGIVDTPPLFWHSEG